jgi:CRP-like cAMP-binding protein
VLHQPCRIILNKLDKSLLADLPPFSRLTSGEMREILDQASSRRFDAGQEVFREAEPATHFFLLLDGTIRVVRTTPEGEQITVLHIAAGQLFGIAAALGHLTYPATAMTASECLALSWPMTQWHGFASRYDGFATETYKIVGARMSEMQSRIAEMATQAVERRIANALLRLINQFGRKVSNGIEIGFPITRQDIAELTGTTLHTVSRLLSAWEKLGIVASSRRKIVVTRAHDLLLLSGPTS